LFTTGQLRLTGTTEVTSEMANEWLSPWLSVPKVNRPKT